MLNKLSVVSLASKALLGSSTVQYDHTIMTGRATPGSRPT